MEARSLVRSYLRNKGAPPLIRTLEEALMVARNLKIMERFHYKLIRRLYLVKFIHGLAVNCARSVLTS